jgi:hypothetical protein
MSKTISFVRLDLLTLKPYYRSAWALLAVGVILGVVQRDVYTMAIICMIYVILLISYPFTIGDKNGLDTLYATLAMRRAHVVLGRYALSAMLFAAVALFSVVLAFGMARVMTLPFSWSLMMVVVAGAFAFFSLAAGIQLPLFFKLGYARARFFVYLPLVLVPAVIYLISLFATSSGWSVGAEQVLLWAEAHSALACAGLLVAGLVVLGLSSAVARRFYLRREF